MLKSRSRPDERQLQTRRIVIAGATSGVGKTLVSLAFMHGFLKKGYTVQSFKIGPDFIDPSYHSLVTGRSSRNLDPWLMGKRGVMESFVSATQGTDIAVIEGVMGVYDGMSGRSDFASTANLAKMLDAAVILVVDASKAARSIAAIALGIIKFDRKLRIAGIVINNLGSDRHAAMVKAAFDQEIRAPVVGMIKRHHRLHFEERHLGLVPEAEVDSENREHIIEVTKYVAEQLDIDKVASLAKNKIINVRVEPVRNNATQRAKIAVALDESFNFYYVENIELLQRAGADLVFFSPVNDPQVPSEIDGMMIGGGFPEVMADKLEKNESMTRSISKYIDNGMPVYGECGGLMYLSRSINGYKGNTRPFRMVGAIDADTMMTKELTLNYTLASGHARLIGGGLLRGHEFHYSRVENVSGDSKFAYAMKIGKGAYESKDGFMVQNCLASYMHLHFTGKPTLADRFVRACAAYSRR